MEGHMEVGWGSGVTINFKIIQLFYFLEISLYI